MEAVKKTIYGLFGFCGMIASLFGAIVNSVNANQSTNFSSVKDTQSSNHQDKAPIDFYRLYAQHYSHGSHGSHTSHAAHISCREPIKMKTVLEELNSTGLAFGREIKDNPVLSNENKSSWYANENVGVLFIEYITLYNKISKQRVKIELNQPCLCLYWRLDIYISTLDSRIFMISLPNDDGIYICEQIAYEKCPLWVTNRIDMFRKPEFINLLKTSKNESSENIP